MTPEAGEAVRSRVHTGLARVRERIAAAAEDAGRRPEDVRLVVVTKGRSMEEIRALLEAGVSDIGENRVQEGYEKWLTLVGSGTERRGTKGEPDGADKTVREDSEGALSEGEPGRESLRVPKFHLVGHLQKNKLSRACRFVDFLHSLDSMELAAAVHRRASGSSEGAGCGMRLLVQVNVTGEPQKHGIAPSEAEAFVEGLLDLGLRPVGLMCMSRLGADSTEHRRNFERLAALRDELARRVCSEIRELSMGMTDDFEEAVAAGSTMVRIGRAIFDSRSDPRRNER